MRASGDKGTIKASTSARIALFVLVAIVCAQGALAEEEASLHEGFEFSLNTGSFIYHVYAPGQQFTQYLQNRFVALEKRLHKGPFDNLVVGTLINSHGNRCILLGVQKNWRRLSRRMTFEGGYAYVGEFFVSTFENCGAEGFYNTIERATGIGFAPYIYHGIQLDLNKYASLEAGAILPGIAVLTLQWHF